MGFLDNLRDGIKGKKEESLEGLEEELERGQLKSQIAGTNAEIAEREALIREAKAKYGKNWKNILGIKGMPSLPSLKSILQGVANPALTRRANAEISGGNKKLKDAQVGGGSKLIEADSGKIRRKI